MGLPTDDPYPPRRSWPGSAGSSRGLLQGGEDLDAGVIRKFAARWATRTTARGVAAFVLLAVTIIWTLRQSRLTHQALERAAAAEKAAAQARTEAQQARAQVRPPKDP